MPFDYEKFLVIQKKNIEEFFNRNKKTYKDLLFGSRRQKNENIKKKKSKI
jgi:hypothetical protein